jgi:hypothetical protein
MCVPIVKSTRRLLAAAVLLSAILGLCLFVSARAQTPPETIRDASLQLWPEFDDPGLLVIFSGDFTDTMSFPRDVSFPLPAGARGIQATEKQADGTLINQAWQIANDRLTFSLPGPSFHIEFYVDRPPSGNQRDISYSFQAPYAIDALDIRVQEPARSTGFTMTPPPQGSSVGNDGMTYSTLQRTNLKPGDKVDLDLRYTKTDQAPSQPIAAVAETPPDVPAVQPAAAATPLNLAAWLPWALIIIGLAALAAAGVYWFTRGRTATIEAAPAPRPRPTRAAQPSQVARTDAGVTAFCTQCGQAFRPEDRFCARCGAPRER